MCGEALKTNLFSGGAAHEIYAENSAWDAVFVDPKNGGAAGKIRQAARTGFHPSPDADL